MPLDLRVRLFIVSHVASMVAMAVLVACMGARLVGTSHVLGHYSDIRVTSQRVVAGIMGVNGALLAYLASPTIENLQGFFDQRLAVDTETDNLVILARDMPGQAAAARAIDDDTNAYLSRLDVVFSHSERTRRPTNSATLESVARFTRGILVRMDGFTDAIERGRRNEVRSLLSGWSSLAGAFAVLALASIGIPILFSELTLRRFTMRVKRLSERAAMAAMGQELNNQDTVRDELGDFDRTLCRVSAQVRSKNETAIRAMEMKSQFVATVSHEIRTPLNGIIGLGEILLRSELNADQRDLAQHLQDSSTALLAIINDILDFSKLEAGRIELESIDFRPADLIDSVVDLMSRAVAAKPVTLLTYVNPQVPSVLRGDPGRLRQVLLNLVGNAVKFTDRGYVLVSVDVETIEGTEARIRFEVVDSGVGMSPHVRERLFQPFAQGDASTTRQFGGTGLGLAISKGFVEMMQGHVDVRSELGRGTTMAFIVRLGVSQPAVPKRHAHLLEGLRTLILSADAGTRDVLRRYTSGWRMRASLIDDPALLTPLLRDAAGKGQPFDLTIIDCAAVQGPCSMCSHVLDDPLLNKTYLVPVNGNLRCMGPFRNTAPKAILQSDVFNSILGVLAPALVVQKTDSTDIPREEAQLSKIDGRAPRVLVAEDNAINQKVASRQLDILGAEYVAAQNGVEALQLLNADSFDIVLMDCSMPVMDGFTATHQIRAQEAGTGKYVPIVAMTANASPQDRVNCLAAGMDDYISKPVTVDSLRTVLTRVLFADRLSAESA